MTQTIEQRLRAIIVKQLGVHDHEIKLDSDLRYAPFHTDSLDQVEIVMAIEDEFNITIPDGDEENIFTFADVLKYVETHVNE